MPCSIYRPLPFLWISKQPLIAFDIFSLVLLHLIHTFSVHKTVYLFMIFFCQGKMHTAVFTNSIFISVLSQIPSTVLCLRAMQSAPVVRPQSNLPGCSPTSVSSKEKSHSSEVQQKTNRWTDKEEKTKWRTYKEIQSHQRQAPVKWIWKRR